MAEKVSEKKFLALLLVLVAVSLVIDLLSLNVLYNIAEESGLKGSLASADYVRYYNPYPPYGNGCDVLLGYDKRSSNCLKGCVDSRAGCMFDACNEEFDCKEDSYAMPGFCSSQRDLEDETCDVRYENCKALC